MKYLSYILIVFGAAISLYAKYGDNNNQNLLLVGIIVLMIGLYRISKTLSSKKKENVLKVKEEKNNLTDEEERL